MQLERILTSPPSFGRLVVSKKLLHCVCPVVIFSSLYVGRNINCRISIIKDGNIIRYHVGDLFMLRQGNVHCLYY